MTVIAFKDGVMAADSITVVGGLYRATAHPKISRAPDGSVAGACGVTSECYAFHTWFSSGSPAPEPAWIGTGDDRLITLIAKPDGTLWRRDENSTRFPVLGPYTTGENDAAMICLGAMLAGMGAEEAVRMAIKWSAFIDGEVQVERPHRAVALVA